MLWNSLKLDQVNSANLLFAKDHNSTEEARSSRWSFATIHASPFLWFWSFGGQSSLQVTICKDMEETGSSGWSFATIPAPSSPCFWSSGEPSSLQMTICKGREEHGGGQIIRMIIFKGHWYLRHWYMMVLSQYRPVLAAIWWYWVSMGLYWLVLGDTGSVQLGTVWY